MESKETKLIVYLYQTEFAVEKDSVLFGNTNMGYSVIRGNPIKCTHANFL